MPPFRKSSSQSMVTAGFHQITIQQVPCPNIMQDGRLQYSVKITVDDNDKPIIQSTFQDPCSTQDHDSCATYLNELLKEGKYDPAIAEQTNKLINEYGQVLFRGLGLGQFSETLKRARLIIEIREADVHQDTRNTIHRLRWEQLEDQELWPPLESRALRKITVRRVTSPATQVIGGPAVTESKTNYVKEKGQVNVLLVIARSFEKKNGQYYEIDPGITLSAILQMKRILEDKSSPHSIALEIVRPGTFKAFKAHLKTRPRGYFDIVHFDVHGRVAVGQNSTTHSSYLHFLHDDFLEKGSDDVKNNLVGVLARDIANELHYYQVPFAVLNACKSANPFGGNDGNLSRLLSMENSLKVLAMSYNISGAAVKLLCRRFYSSFFRDLNSFSDAASQARTDLRNYRVRSEIYPRIQLQDWFVPVTYARVDSALVIPSKEKESRFLNVQVRKPRWRSLSPQSASTKTTSSASSYISSKSVQHDESGFLALQINPDLMFERQLMRDNVLRLYGPSELDNKSYLGYLTDLWRMTTFAQQPYEFDSSSYMEDPRRELLGAREYIWGLRHVPHLDLPCQLKDLKTDYIPRPVIIFYQAQALFPDDPSDDQLDRRNALNEFLNELLDEEITVQYGTSYRPPYIIFVSTADIQSASILTFSAIGGQSFNYSDRPSTVRYASNCP